MRNVSYSVLQYRHERALGEAVNLGVLAFSPEEGKAAFEYDQNYRRLSELYSHFDGPGLRSALRRLGNVIAQMNSRSQDRLIPVFDSNLKSADQLVRSIWPDTGSSIVASPPRFVATEDVEEEARRLFDRLIVSARPGKVNRGNRKDEDVWASVVHRMAAIEGLAAQFKPHTFASEVDLDFVARRKGDNKYIAIEPVAFDYVNSSSVKERTYELVGKATGLKDVADFAELVVVVGETRRKPEVGKTVHWAEQYMLKNAPKLRVTPENSFDQSLLGI